MFYYLRNSNNEITQFTEFNKTEDNEIPAFLNDWESTDKKIMKLANGKIAFEEDIDLDAEKKAISKKENNISINEQISDYAQKLSATDYIASKIAEGVATKEEYAEQLANRQTWRDKINELRSQLA